MSTAFRNIAELAPSLCGECELWQGGRSLSIGSESFGLKDLLGAMLELTFAQERLCYLTGTGDRQIYASP